MNKKFLFCDVDETLISIKSMFSFHHYWFQQWLPIKHGSEHQREYEDINAIMRALALRAIPRTELNRRYYEFYAGRDIVEVNACAQEWFAETSAEQPDFWLHQSCNEMRRLRSKGYEPVLVSGSLTEILKPIVKALEVEHLLAINLERSGEHFTGNILAPQTIGVGKVKAITMFLAQQNVDSSVCAAMGDHGSDIPMLEMVGHPIAVIGDPQLAAHAANRGWRKIVLGQVPESGGEIVQDSVYQTSYT